MLVGRHSCNIRTDTLRLNPGFGLFVDNSHVYGSIRKFFACKILEAPQPETGNHHDEAQLAPCGLTKQNKKQRTSAGMRFDSGGGDQ